MTQDDLSLEARGGLPETLRVLLADYPREGWPSDPGFGGLVAFWLDRHLMFRNLTSGLQQAAESEMDGALARDALALRIGRLGSALVQGLHGHHQIEDQHYFPRLAVMDRRLLRGFEILDKDHHAMDGLLDRFARSANAVIRGEAETGTFREELLSFSAMLERHLWDEEDLVVPVILRHGTAGLE